MLFADESLNVNALIGTLGGVGSALAAVGLALYVAYDKIVTRRETSATVKAALTEREVGIEALANSKVADAYERLGAERKAVHERDVTELRRRLEELERREGKCQETCSALRIQNDEQAREMASLRAKIESLEYKLRASGAIPASSGPSPAV